ncbi:MAG: ABC transporter permease subunit [Planctomycetota bacterium]|jgi:oligopeptide transport system permease protein|nr:ABC transporter permease subunit [Pirellulaceae bacterium]MDP7378588.1 ABC transporter permease subunit [Pirellulaceae bacterium]MEC7599685.1 ABC transporter permease subunit [Planctomycetota bacterium]MEC8240642.1 ABC transporter permease subunit [Planctomycetota bacterium]MEC8303141.1 ABC transporter permease subunit [Planctomycetota bacterium]
MSIVSFLIKRSLWIVATLWLVYTVSFFLMRSVPGGPFSSERNVPPEIERNLKARYNLDLPLWEQYQLNLSEAIRGDLGPSLTLQDYSVNEVIAEGFPVSASLGILAMTFALSVGVTTGVISAVRRYQVWDRSLMTLATLGIAIPNFVLASLLIMTFVFLVPLFPSGGWGSLSHLVLPVIALGSAYAASIARLTRTGMLEVIGQDFITTAKAKGLSERTVLMRHALPCALTPVVSYLGPATAGILTGSLVLEKVFFLPGMGSHFIEAALQRDYPLALGMVLVYTLLLMVLNLIVDFTYAILDPRVELQA